MSERDYRDWLETPAGQWSKTWGITHQPDPMAAAAIVSETRIRREAAYGRELYPEEVRALHFDAERRTTTVHASERVPATSWEIGQRMRWGVGAPVPFDDAMVSVGEMPPAQGVYAYDVIGPRS